MSKKKEKMIAENLELSKKVEELEKQLQSEKNVSEYRGKERDKALEEIEQMHLMFDGLVNNPRELEKEESWMGKTKLSLAARFARYLQQLVNADRNILQKNE